MKKVILLSTISAMALFATNGDTLIGTGTKSRGMGGAGIGVSHCAESTLSNPALITCTKGTSISFGGTVFMPDISTKMGMAPSYDSDSDMNVIPSVAISHKIDNNWYVGIGMWGTAGMGVDFRDAEQTATDSGNMNMLTNLQLMQFAPSIAYSTGKAGIALTTIIQYGALDINYKMPTQSGVLQVGDGVSQDFGYGYNLGAYYDFENGVTLGAVYKSKIKMTYDHQLSTATEPFVGMGIFPKALSDDLDQPSEIGIGIGYKLNQHTFALDYKKIKWSDASGYKDFGWEDQDVYALGYQYKNGKWKYRAGYNYAETPVKEQPNTPTGQAINVFNLLGFPATAEKHYTLGIGYEFSDNFYVDLAYVYAPETTETMDTTMFTGGDTTVKHSESSLSVQFSYRFF